MSFNHEEIWEVIYKVAKANGLSASGLAKKAGLNPTTFNKSKRFNKDGRERWPSMESISKVLVVTNTSMEDFSKFFQIK